MTRVGSKITWTDITCTDFSKEKKGKLLDHGSWGIPFGQKRFEWRPFGDKKGSSFRDGEGFIKALKKRGFEQLGAGAFSTVLGKPGKDRVIKVIRRPDSWIDYVHWGAKQGSPFAPKVFSYKKIKGKKTDFSVAIVERLEYTFNRMPDDHALRSLPSLFYMAEKNPMAARFVEVLVPGLTNYMSGLYKEFGDHYSLDLHSGNLMVRKDGSFVVADPVCCDPRSDYTRLKAGDFSPALLFPRKGDRFLVASSYRHRG